MSFAPFRLKRPLFLLLAVLAALRLTAQPMPGTDAKWQHLRSEHFELYSRNSESDSRMLLHNLELVHGVFFEIYRLTPVRTLPVTVYFFSRDKYFESYKPEAFRKLTELGSYYHADPDRGVLVMAPLPSYEVAQKLAFSGYTYHLFRLTGEMPPAWYSHGIAGIFRNLVLNRDDLEIGRPDAAQVGHLQTTTLVPVERMFAANHQSDLMHGSDEASRLFHDESWALVHYLYFGAHKIPPEGVARFINYALRSSRQFDDVGTKQVFEAETGVTYAQLNKALERYFRSGRYAYATQPLPKIPPAKTYELRRVPVEEINLRLAELAVRANQSPAGRLALLQAADGPEAARVQETLGAAAVRAGDWDEARNRWERAVDSGSTNPAVLHELAEAEARSRFARFDIHFRLPEEAAEKLRNLLAKSIAAAPRQTSAYEILAWVEATARDPRIANVNLVQENYTRLREQARTLLALAVVRMRLGDKPGAAQMLDALEQSEPNDWIRYGIELTRAEIEGRPVDRSKLPSGKSSGPKGPRMPPLKISLPPGS